MIQIAIQIECLHWTKFQVPDCNLDQNLDTSAPCKQGKNLRCDQYKE